MFIPIYNNGTRVFGSVGGGGGGGGGVGGGGGGGGGGGEGMENWEVVGGGKRVYIEKMGRG